MRIRLFCITSNINNERSVIQFVWLILIQSKEMTESLFEFYLHISYYWCYCELFWDFLFVSLSNSSIFSTIESGWMSKHLIHLHCFWSCLCVYLRIYFPTNLHLLIHLIEGGALMTFLVSAIDICVYFVFFSSLFFQNSPPKLFIFFLFLSRKIWQNLKWIFRTVIGVQK